MSGILDAFDTYPNEALLVGKLLAGYATLEIDLMNCVAVRTDIDITLKVMFRDRGETRRINVADALGRQRYIDWGLGTEFAMAVGAMRYCLRLRNQYAHCNWYDDKSGKLAFVNLEELAEENDLVVDLRSLTVHHVDEPLLREQYAFLQHASNCLVWVNYEGRFKDGSIAVRRPKPAQMRQPDLHLP